MKKRPRYNQNVTVTIKSLGRNGEGIGYWQKFTLFVDGALPEEEIRGRICQKEKNFGRVNISSIQKPSPFRVSSPCPFFPTCGGCQFLHFSMEGQLKFFKQKRVEEAFFKNQVPFEKIFPVEPSPKNFHYRTKLQLPCKTVNNQLEVGFFGLRNKEFVPINTCLLHDPLGENILNQVKTLLNEWKFLAYNEQTQEGDLRFLIVRTSLAHQQALLLFVTAKPLTAQLKKFSEMLMEKIPEIQGIVHSRNPYEDNRVLGEEFSLLTGNDKIFEKIQNIDFQYSANSFFQVNPLQANAIFEKVLTLADLQNNDFFLDAFCGVGIFSILAASQGARGVGIENVFSAIEDAKATAKKYSLSEKIHFECGDVLEKLDCIPKNVQIAFINPPRKGCDEALLNRLKELPLRKILYLSCDPTSLAQNCQFLQDRFRVKHIYPFDMFPQTSHVETLVELVPNEKAF